MEVSQCTLAMSEMNEHVLCGTMFLSNIYLKGYEIYINNMCHKMIEFLSHGKILIKLVDGTNCYNMSCKCQSNLIHVSIYIH